MTGIAPQCCSGAHLHVVELGGASGFVAVCERRAFGRALSPVREHSYSDRLQLSRAVAPADVADVGGGCRAAGGGWGRVKHPEHDPSHLCRIPVGVLWLLFWAILPGA